MGLGKILGGGQKAPDYRPTADATKYAADLEYKATKESQELLKEQWAIDRDLLEAERKRAHSRWSQDRAQFQPWVRAGTWAINALKDGVRAGDFNMPEWVPPDERDWERSPGFEFRLQRAQEGIRRQGNIGGSAYSGATLTALQRQAYQFARDDYDWARKNSLEEYGVEQDRRNQRFDQLSGLANQGAGHGTMPTAGLGARYSALQASLVGRQAAMGSHYATQMGRLGVQGAQAIGAGAIGSANAMIQGQHAANAARQQNFDNTMSILGLGLGAWMGLG